MKFHIFLTLAIIFFVTALVPTTEGYHAHVKQRLSGRECKIWVTDINGKYVAGDKKYHPCYDGKMLDIDTKSNDKYLLYASTIGELETKHRGPFKADICYIIEGNSLNWRLEPLGQCNIS